MPARAWLPIFVLFATLSASQSAGAASYAVDGFTVGGQISPVNSDYRFYACKPSGDFAEAVRCERTQQTRLNGGNAAVLNTLVHGQDGTALYVSNSATTSLNRTGAQNDINDLSRTINEQPRKVLWLPENQNNPTMVIAIWGSVKLEQVLGEPVFDLSQGNSPHLGALIDTVGDLKLSANQDLPIYRIGAGSGFVYAASLSSSGKGHRQYVAVDGTQLVMRQFQLAAQNVLQRDQALASNDYSLWPEMALATRRLSLDTSPETATAELNKLFAKSPSKKLYSHVWAVLPGGPIEHLPSSEYWPVDIYGPKTEHPSIRHDLQSVISERPSDPFIEFAYYVTGDFDKAIAANPKSVISNAIHYARSHAVIESILKDAVAIVNSRKSKDADNPDGVVERLQYLRDNAGIYDDKRIGSFVPRFAERAALAKPDLESVMANKTAHHADDAAYFLGWLAFQADKSEEALPYLSQAVVIGNGDFQEAGLKLTVKIQQERSPAEQYRIVDSDPNFSKQPVLWYVAARSAYREYDYETVIKEVKRALQAMNVPIDRLPATTDPQRLGDAIKRFSSDLYDDLNFVELPYLLQASTEFLNYEMYLKSAATEHADVLTKRARALIVKYSMLLNPPDQPAHPLPLAHKDLRQALHLIDVTLANVPKDAAYALREWLYYRKVRIAAVYAPKTVPDIVAAMQQEFPNSKLLDDVLAEQLYAQGVVMQDVHAAETTFRTLIQKYPNGNAVDNAYGWMAILYRCVGRNQDALAMNREILKRFPLTRHAKYARERMANPSADNCGLSDFANNT
jgi:tetratricopeptide (TPR) repeat protein